MFGAKKYDSSRSPASWPARKCSNSGDMPPGPSPAKTGVPSLPRSDRWMWQELPSRSLYFAMNVSDWPCWAAISLAPFL